MSDYTRIPLSQGKCALIDRDDAERVLAFKWSAMCPSPTRKNPKWYAARGDYSGAKRVAIYLHRFILDAPPGVEVDHQNGDGLDCRRSNLRIASRSQNAINYERRPRSSSYRGVYPRPGGQRWYAQIRVAGKHLCLGSFDSPKNAARAYDDAAKELHGDFAVLNFPSEHPSDPSKRFAAPVRPRPSKNGGR